MQWHAVIKREDDVWINLKNTTGISDRFMCINLVFESDRICWTKNMPFFRSVQSVFISIYYILSSALSKYLCWFERLSKMKHLESHPSIHVRLQDHLVAQRSLYKRLKEESELDVKRAFLANVEYFRANHAARIIQRNWKLYCARMSWKKRKSRRLTQNWIDSYISSPRYTIIFLYYEYNWCMVLLSERDIKESKISDICIWWHFIIKIFVHLR